MPVYVQFTLVCGRTGCSSTEDIAREYDVPSQPITGPPLPERWSELNGELLCPDHSQDCLDGDEA